jgi:hypothetical protein
VQTEKGLKTFKFVNSEKTIRYLGSWSTVDLDEKIGLEKLKEKVKVKMERIRRLRATPSTKGLLIKARVISVINYTASVQKVEEKELEKWEKEIYGIMVKGYGR